jgi:hypothetical protein
VRHMTGQLQNDKLSMSSIIDELEVVTEIRPLTTQEIELKSQSNA